MPPVTVLVLAPAAGPDAGPLTRTLDDARASLAELHRAAFLAAGADRVIVHREPPDDTPFGARLRRLLPALARADPFGLVVLGAGSIPLATGGDRRALVDAAAAAQPGALANVRFSADAIAVACATTTLRDLPDVASDNALPRWLAEVAGVPVHDLAARRHLAMDVDSPLDLLLLEGTAGPGRVRVPAQVRDADAANVRSRLTALRALIADPSAELLVAGRTSSAELRWLERRTRSRSRVLIEERGLRSASLGPLLGRANRRPPFSLLGELLERDGPDSLGRHVAAMADGALIDSRVLLAHRLGAEERAWPPGEDRFASDLLLADRVADRWLRALTRSAVESPVPILLGGHSLVGPGLRLALGPGLPLAPGPGLRHAPGPVGRGSP
jgi:CTP:molybdopterin cytidylyltransferase MocA